MKGGWVAGVIFLQGAFSLLLVLLGALVISGPQKFGDAADLIVALAIFIVLPIGLACGLASALGANIVRRIAVRRNATNQAIARRPILVAALLGPVLGLIGAAAFGLFTPPYLQPFGVYAGWVILLLTTGIVPMVGFIVVAARARPTASV